MLYNDNASGPDPFMPPGDEIDIDHMPPPTAFFREGGVVALVWGTMDPDPRDRVRDRGLGSLVDLARAIQVNTGGVYFCLLRDEKSHDYAFFVDLFSCKKVFYCQLGDRIRLSTSLGRLARASPVRPEVDLATVATFLMYDYVPTNHTLLQGIRSVRPFTVYRLSDGTMDESGGWPFRETPSNVTYPEAVRGTLERLEAAFLSASMMCDSLIVPLSGGRDSRLLLGLALKHGRHTISSLTFGQPGTLDYEIGVGLAGKLGLDHQTYAIGDDFYETHIVPSTPVYNGLINHVLAPCNFLTGRFAASPRRAVLSGYMGDVFRGWGVRTIPVLECQGVQYPTPKQLPLETVLEMLPDARGPLLQRLAQLQAGFDDCSDDAGIPWYQWYFRIRATKFTAVGVFSEGDDFLFLAPFLDTELLKWMFSLANGVKRSERFYRDLVATDSEIAPLFAYPLKHLKGADYFSGRWANARSTARLAWKAHRGRVIS